MLGFIRRLCGFAAKQRANPRETTREFNEWAEGNSKNVIAAAENCDETLPRDYGRQYRLLRVTYFQIHGKSPFTDDADKQKINLLIREHLAYQPPQE